MPLEIREILCGKVGGSGIREIVAGKEVEPPEIREILCEKDGMPSEVRGILSGR